MTMEPETLTVCICTYRRPHLLRGLLARLREQVTEGRFAYEIVVVDNDPQQSARGVVDIFGQSPGPAIRYAHEPQPNIALARNRALRNASGDFAALIDDDEIPGPNWLLNLYRACRTYECDGVLGPVSAKFEHQPPPWVVRGRFYERDGPRTGQVLRWQDTRSGNVLLRRRVFAADPAPFDPAFPRGGEDIDFFQRAMSRGRLFVWCEEAAVQEVVPPERCRRSYMLKRAWLRGRITLGYSGFGAVYLVKSAVAIPVYTLAIPLAGVLGQDALMKIAIRLTEHAGRLLGIFGHGAARLATSVRW
jgi:glycosyltransferase involved in cell wall biosynthesis